MDPLSSVVLVWIIEFLFICHNFIYSHFILFLKISLSIQLFVVIQRTFTKEVYRHVSYMVDYFYPDTRICRVFSFPFKFYLLEDITNNIPNIVFNSVTHLKLQDKNPFKHEFFVRLACTFPSLKNLSISNIQPTFSRFHEHHLLEKDWWSIIEYPHLVSLDVEKAMTCDGILLK